MELFGIGDVVRTDSQHYTKNENAQADATLRPAHEDGVKVTSANLIPDPRTQKLPVTQNNIKALILIALLFGSFYLANSIANAVDAATLAPAVAFVLKWGAIVVLAFVDGMLATGIGVLSHEGTHRVYCRSPFWNDLISGILSALAFQPFYSNRQFHLQHHTYTHQPGMDPENMMHNHSFWRAAIFGSGVVFTEQCRLMFVNLSRIGDRKYFGRGFKDLAFMSFAIAVYFWALPQLGLSVWYTVVPMLVALGPIFTLRALSDHYGIPAVNREKRQREEVLDADKKHWDKELGNRQKELSSWVILTNPWMDWLWSNIHYHEVHHRYPYVSHVYLKGIFEATRGRAPYYVVRGYVRSLIHHAGRTYYGHASDRTPLPDPYC